MSPPPTHPPKPELLAPAGDFDAMRAAVANGADAVYFGLSQFNARHRATNFSLEDLPKTIEYLHSHNVRGYVTFNTLIFSDELPEAARFIRAVAEAGADAVIVQDLGLARLIRRLAPGLHVHGSTQMTLTEPLGVEFVRKLGVKRVILGRELSVADVRKVTAGTDLPVEVFVHGALCVSYSGQCLTSEAIGGRSANRGQCAQACRLPYDLIVDGAARDLGEKAYLLSPQDLAAYDLIDDLADAGVCSVKIEGRLKSAHYVAATTQTYRSAIDAIGHSAGSFTLSRERQLELAQSFSRGFTHGFLDGVDHQALVHARFPKSRGVKAGVVVEVTDRSVVVRLNAEPAPVPRASRPCLPGQRADESELKSFGSHRTSRTSETTVSRGGTGETPVVRRDNSPSALTGFTAATDLKPNDGVVFDEGHPEQDEQGGRILAARPLRRPSGIFVELSFDSGSVNLSAIAPGAIVWKTDDPAVRKRLGQSFAREKVANRVSVDATVRAEVGSVLTTVISDDAGRTVSVEWDQPLEAAQKYPLTEQVFREQFGRMGDSPFELRRVLGLENGSRAMVPKSVLNDLRRRAVAKLIELRDEPQRRVIADPDALDHLREEIASGGTGRGAPSPEPQAHLGTGLRSTGDLWHPQSGPLLHILVRTLDQLRAVVAWSHPETGLKASTVYCDFEDIRKYKEAVAIARAAGVPVGLATVRIIKPGEEGLLRQVAACEPDLILFRNLAGLSFFSTQFPALPLVADYSLNIANELTAAILLEHNVRRMVPSYDLNWRQMSAMFGRISPRHFESVIHQHMPMFHMEHCVFCHTLSNGTSYKDCGRPCDEHRVDLKDRAGIDNPLIADVGCRNTVYNGVAQSGAEYVPRMRQMGIQDFRVELLREDTNDVSPLLDRYADVLSGRSEPRTAVRSLRIMSQLGVVAGTFARD